MGKCLGQWSLPLFWNFTPEHVQNPDKLVKYWGKLLSDWQCPRNKSLGCAGSLPTSTKSFSILFSTLRGKRKREVPEPKDRLAGTVATKAPSTGSAAATYNQPGPVPATPAEKMKTSSFHKAWQRTRGTPKTGGKARGNDLIAISK